jgi:hypothetical protein
MQKNLGEWSARLEALKANGEATAEQLATWNQAGAAARGMLLEMQAAAARYATIRGELDAAWDTMARSVGLAAPRAVS